MFAVLKTTDGLPVYINPLQVVGFCVTSHNGAKTGIATSDGDNTFILETPEEVAMALARARLRDFPVAVETPNERIAALEKLISHCWVHSGYDDCGFKQMTTEQQLLYKEITSRPAPGDEP